MNVDRRLSVLEIAPHPGVKTATVIMNEAGRSDPLSGCPGYPDGKGTAPV
jgi:hypothetical protein